MRLLSSVGLACGLVGVACAQVQNYTAQPGVYYSVNVPSASASSGAGDLFIQIQAPSSMQWVGVGQGGQMKGANIFIIYSDSDGQNITLSPRLGAGNFQPDYNSAAQVSLLEGSGIANGLMTANIRCASCASWNGGSMSFSDASSSWIWAVRSGSPIASNSLSANLQQHDVMNNFNFDLTKATGGNSLNPFVSNAANNGVTTTASAGSVPTGSSSNPSGSSGGGDGGGSSGGSSDGSEQTQHMRVMAHGIIMSLAFLWSLPAQILSSSANTARIFFPFGALTVRFLSVKATVWIHASLQLFAYAFAIAGMGIGVWLAVTEQALNMTHPIIGLTVISGLFLQPFLGLIHHFIYRKTQRRTLWAHAHIWWGRALLILGAINGGLGLQLSANTVNGEIAYGVIAGVVFLIYVAVVSLSWLRSKGKGGSETGEKLTGRRSRNDGERRRSSRSRSRSGSRNRGQTTRVRGPGGDSTRTWI
ncbi:hypothetical protein MMC17_009270 [Xylographa soralifera]|nr:hypothetical protein [Xylographa soralifera]